MERATCEQCGSSNVIMIGTLGEVTYYRCGHCGWGWGVWK